MIRRSGRAWGKLLEYAQQQINVEAPLVSFVDDQRVVAPQAAVALQLFEQDAISHQL